MSTNKTKAVAARIPTNAHNKLTEMAERYGVKISDIVKATILKSLGK